MLDSGTLCRFDTLRALSENNNFNKTINDSFSRAIQFHATKLLFSTVIVLKINIFP